MMETEAESIYVSPEFVHGPVCLRLQLEGQLVD